MSVYIRSSSKNRTLRGLKSKIDYVWDDGKSIPQFRHSLGVRDDNEGAYEDMLLNKQLFLKKDGRQYQHWILSFDAEVTGEQADKVGTQVLKLLEDKWQAIMCTHLNTRNVHCHYLINSVQVGSGKKFSESKSDMLLFRKKINTILYDAGLSLIHKIEVIEENEWAEVDDTFLGEFLEELDEDFDDLDFMGEYEDKLINPFEIAPFWIEEEILQPELINPFEIEPFWFTEDWIDNMK